MPAHRAQHAQAALPSIPLAGVLLTLLVSMAVYLLAAAATDSSTDPSNTSSVGVVPVVVITAGARSAARAMSR